MSVLSQGMQLKTQNSLACRRVRKASPSDSALLKTQNSKLKTSPTSLTYLHSPPSFEHPDYLRHRQWMERAFLLAQQAGDAGEVPVGAIVVGANGQILAEAENRRERDHDPTAHAEILALRMAGRALGNWHLNRCILYVTLEPCPMCAGALVLARLGLLVYGADDPKAGAVRSVLNLPDSACSNHHLSVLGGILETPCRQQLQTWFALRRDRAASNHLA